MVDSTAYSSVSSTPRR
jgi:hypothetical protein